MTLDESYFLSGADGGDDDAQTLDFDKTPTVLLVFAANRFTRSAARHYQTRYNIGAMDWRMLVMLTKEPNIPAARACQVIGIDKAAISRSLARLESSGLARATAQARDPRRKNWQLTMKGQHLHDQILKDALDRQSQILNGFTEQEVSTLNGLLRRMLDNMSNMDSRP